MSLKSETTPPIFFYIPGSLASIIVLLAEVLPDPPNCVDCGMARGINAVFIAIALVFVGIILTILKRKFWKRMLVFNFFLPVIILYIGLEVPKTLCWHYGRKFGEPDGVYSRREYRECNILGITLECWEFGWQVK